MNKESQKLIEKFLVGMCKAIAGISTSVFLLYGFYYGLWFVLFSLPDFWFLDSEYKGCLLAPLEFGYVKPIVQLIHPEMLSSCLSGNYMAYIFTSRQIAETSFFISVLSYVFLIFSPKIKKLCKFF